MGLRREHDGAAQQRPGPGHGHGHVGLGQHRRLHRGGDDDRLAAAHREDGFVDQGEHGLLVDAGARLGVEGYHSPVLDAHAAVEGRIGDGARLPLVQIAPEGGAVPGAGGLDVEGSPVEQVARPPAELGAQASLPAVAQGGGEQRPIVEVEADLRGPQLEPGALHVEGEGIAAHVGLELLKGPAGLCLAEAAQLDSTDGDPPQDLAAVAGPVHGEDRGAAQRHGRKRCDRDDSDADSSGHP